PDVFDCLEDARAFAHAFVTKSSTLNLLGLVVHPGDRDRWIAEFDGARGSTWILLPDDAEFLGWEPVTIDSAGPAHSWLCSGLEREVHEWFGVKPNAL